MQGIQYVTDEKGQKIAVQINLKNLERFGKIFLTVYLQNSEHKNQGSPSILSGNG